MPYVFNTFENESAEFKMLVRGSVDSYALTAEFTRHPYNTLKEQIVVYTKPLTSSGNEITMTLTADEVNDLESTYFNIVAVKPGVQIVVDTGRLNYASLPPVAEVVDGQLYLIDEQGRKHPAGSVVGPRGLKGDLGLTGPANNLTIGQVTTGSSAAANITGAAPNQTLNITIPEGTKGDKGDRGTTGPANKLTIGSVTTSAPGAPAAASITGVEPNQVLHLNIPRGLTGPAATVAVGTVTTGAAGSAATVTNAGDSSQAVLNFAIPQGSQGVKGDPGDLTSANQATTSTVVTVPATPTTLTRILAGNVTVNALSTPASTLSFTSTVVLKQAASGGPYTVTWPSGITWAGGAPAPTMPTAANARLLVHLFWSGQEWFGMVGGTFF